MCECVGVLSFFFLPPHPDQQVVCRIVDYFGGLNYRGDAEP